jgi:hypothetical protein
MGKLPAIFLYPGDWQRDDVSGCSLAAQGLWLRMMFIGHDSERYGYLEMNGSPIPPGSIARRCGCTLAQYETLLSELERAGVPSRTPEGVLFSRRMVRDAEKRAQDANRQAKHRDKYENRRDASRFPQEIQRVTLESRSSNARVTPVSRGSSVSSSNSNPKTPLPPAAAGEQLLLWGNETIEVQMGRCKRIPNLEKCVGGRGSDVVAFLSRKGLRARIVGTG